VCDRLHGGVGHRLVFLTIGHVIPLCSQIHQLAEGLADAYGRGGGGVGEGEGGALVGVTKCTGGEACKECVIA
jgi:hypothetical protein